MTQTLPVVEVSLDWQQVAQLLAHCAAYRSHLWLALLPTPQRNQTIRHLQALQGRLENIQERGQEHVTLSFNAEEGSTLRHLLSGLVHLYAGTPPSEQRTTALASLAALRLLVERAFRKNTTQAF